MKFTDLAHLEDFRPKDWNSTETPYLTACLNLYNLLLESDFVEIVP